MEDREGKTLGFGGAQVWASFKWTCISPPPTREKAKEGTQLLKSAAGAGTVGFGVELRAERDRERLAGCGYSGKWGEGVQN